MSPDPQTGKTAAASAAQLSIRPACSLILMRRSRCGAEVLMGKRSAKAAFMASKYVFPGGAVDPEDARQSQDLSRISSDCARRLALQLPPEAPSPAALVTAGLRELDEETGLQLGPDSGALRFVFRAITPPGRSRRFDARFLLAQDAAISGDCESFSAASGELSDLHWIDLEKARALDLPFVTQIVLAELRAILKGAPDEGVPFFDNSGDQPLFSRLI